MDLNDAQIGDVAILSDGTQAVIHSIYRRDGKSVLVEFDRDVTGWENCIDRSQWYYNRDGSFFVADFDDKHDPHVDIVKVIHND